MEDISQRESAEALLSAEKHTLQMIAEGAALPDVLNDLCGAIDEQSPGLMSMVSLTLESKIKLLKIKKNHFKPD